MAEYEEKFIVINTKRFIELNEPMSFCREHPAILILQEAWEDFKEAYERDTGKVLNRKYYVVNQDESYADNVIKHYTG